MSTHAAALAYQLFLSTLALSLVGLALLGLAEDVLPFELPPGTEEQFANLTEASATLGVVSFVALLWTASALSRRATRALAVIFRTGPERGVRGGVRAIVITLGFVVLVGALPVVTLCLGMIKFREVASTLSDLTQGVEAIVNEAILLVAAIYFLVTSEKRMKRSRALKALHELRSLAHIIDMHQLTKDPEILLGDWQPTDASPRRSVLTPFQLERYLDYCSELLAVLSKVAALYVQHFEDEVVLRAVDEVENLAAGLSRKIWQKITILDRLRETRSA